jgi:mannose-6-phosphate isomerase
MDLYPLTFEPILKERIWGGRRLEQLYHKALPDGVPVGESWEISDRPGDVSVVSNGPLAGKDLHWLVENLGRQLLGPTQLHAGRFPLLIKILDARASLSLQVHPPAARAALLGGAPKTEMWYVAEAVPDAELYVGLRRGCTKKEFGERIRDGTVADCFHRVRVRAGDVMFLPSGRVHALGAGMVIFEIQQNSDTTYRVFDWNRLGLDGKPRDLHIKESLESIDFEDFEPGLVQPRLRPGPVGLAALVEDELFSVDLGKMNVGQSLSLVPGKMQILGIVSGTLRVRAGAEELVLAGGQFCLLPASLPAVALQAQSAATFLRVDANKKAAL